MRAVLVLVWVAVVSLVSTAQPSGDPYSQAVVRAALAQYAQGVRFSVTTKRVHHLGDRVSVGLLKVLDEHSLYEPQTAATILSLIRDAFAYPNLISSPEDKKPRVTLFTLHCMGEHAENAGMRQEIAGLITFLQARSSAHTEPHK